MTIVAAAVAELNGKNTNQKFINLHSIDEIATFSSNKFRLHMWVHSNGSTLAYYSREFNGFQYCTHDSCVHVCARCVLASRISNWLNIELVAIKLTFNNKRRRAKNSKTKPEASQHVSKRRAQLTKKMLIKNNSYGFWAHVFLHLYRHNRGAPTKLQHSFHWLKEPYIKRIHWIQNRISFLLWATKKKAISKIEWRKRQEANKWA